MIIITGATGFIGSVLLFELNQMGYSDIILVDELGHHEEGKHKFKNIQGANFVDFLSPLEFEAGLEKDKFDNVRTIFHLGAISSTTFKDDKEILKVNYQLPKKIFRFCAKKNVKFIYASSAATYGDGSQGYDDEGDLNLLRPLNLYGQSKHLFDLWVTKQYKNIAQKKESSVGFIPPVCFGLKYFNVYGPHEYHKNDMASMAYKAANQIQNQGQVSLFSSSHKDFADGQESRDFIYVKDAAKITALLGEKESGFDIVNVGTGEANSFLDLVTFMAKGLNQQLRINWISMQKELNGQYQYFTQATTKKLFKHLPQFVFRSFEDAVVDYASLVNDYLFTKKRP